MPRPEVRSAARPAVEGSRMPLLPAEPCLYPPDLFTPPGESVGGSWWVLHTRPRTEKAVARALLAHQVPFFLPVYENSRRVNGRLQTSHLPLFSGYLFLLAGDEGRTQALETNQIANCLPVSNPAVLYRELSDVHRAMTAGLPIGPESQLVPGTPVAITGGPLSGMRGKVVRRGKKLNLVVEVNLLRQGVAVEIESWMVEAAAGDDAPAVPNEP